MITRREISIVVGNREEARSNMYAEVIRDARQDVDFVFSVATTVPDFIQLASDSHTDLAMCSCCPAI